MLGFILAFAAGFLTQRAEEPVARPLARWLAPLVTVSPAEMRLFSFVVLMLGAAVLARILHSGTPFWFVLGGVLGVFALRLSEAAQKAMQGRRPPQA